MNGVWRLGALFAALAAGLGLIAVLAPLPDRVTDRDVYEKTAARLVVPDCTDLHCFRVLVPWLLGRLPGPSILRWRTYAVLSNAAAGVAVFVLALRLGLVPRVAAMASVLSAFGFGALYTLHDSFTSDPLMFAAGPFLTAELLAGRFGLSAVCAAIGVLAKEFAAVPLYLYALFAALGRRWTLAARAFVAANFALIVWMLFTLTMIVRFNYWLGGSDSANIAGGAGLAPWLHRQSARGVAAAMFNEFGALYILAPIGLYLGPRSLRLLTVAALPLAAVLGYVQQPDRALWNFHFLATPLAAITLDRSPALLAAGTIACFAIGNLRVGAQLPIAVIAHAAIAASLVLAFIAGAFALRGAGRTGVAAEQVS